MASKKRTVRITLAILSFLVVAGLVALAVLNNIHRHRRIDGLIQDLGSDNIEVREKAEGMLEGIGGEALPALRKARSDGSPEIAARAVRIIDKIDFFVTGRIAFWRRERRIFRVYLTNPDNGGSDLLYQVPIPEDEWTPASLHLQWIEGTRNLLVISEHYSRKRDWGWYHSWMIDAVSTKATRIDEPEAIGWISYVQAVPRQGTRVAFGTDGGALWLADLEGKDHERLKVPEGSILHSAWSRDGKKILFEVWNNGPSMYLISPEGGEAEFFCAGDLEFPSFTPSGDHVVGIAKGNSSVAELAVVHVSTKRAVRIATRLECDHPRISPDGKRVAYVRRKSHEYAESGQITLIDLDGKNESKVATGRRPCWSPDGKSIAYERDDHVYVLDLTTAFPLEKHVGLGHGPAWSR